MVRTDFVNVRFKKATMQRLKILKAKRNDKMFDDTLLFLLKNYGVKK